MRRELRAAGNALRAFAVSAIVSIVLGCGTGGGDERAAQAYLDRISEPLQLLSASPPLTDGGSLSFVFLDPDGDSLRFCSRVYLEMKTTAKHPDIFLGGRAARSEDGIRVPWRGQSEHRVMGLLDRWLAANPSESTPPVRTALARLQTGHQ